jgi:hypothetical protein
MDQLRKTALSDLFTDLQVDPESNLAKQWYMYGTPEGEVLYDHSYPMQEFLGRHGYGGVYDPDSKSLAVRKNSGRNTDVLSHELTHQNIHKENIDGGFPNSLYMAGTTPNHSSYRKKTELLSTLSKLIENDATSNYNVEVTTNPLYNKKHFQAKGDLDSFPYPANIISNDEEVIAGIRGMEGRLPSGKTFWDTDEGKRIKSKLDQVVDPKFSSKVLDRLMFPLNQFAYEGEKPTISDKIKSYLTYKNFRMSDLFK